MAWLLVPYVLVAIAMIGLILLQQGKGAEMGASFGSGSSQTVFGAAGATSFLTKLTWGLALTFFALSLLLAWNARKQLDAATVPAAATQGSTTATVPTVPAKAPATGNVPSVPTAPGK
jgi:preprotein translocase subunit SecG